MTEPRQKPISVPSSERALLNQQKERWEKVTGQKTDWGQFLGTVALLGLAAAGVYSLVKARERSLHSVDVQCCECNNTFVMALPTEIGRAIYTTCPHCDRELVVDLGISR